MNRDEMLKFSKFNSEFSVNDWNELVYLKFGKYFDYKSDIEKNKESLRAEIINYISLLHPDEKYLELFDKTYSFLKKCYVKDKDYFIEKLADHLECNINSDMNTMTSVLLRPNLSELSERDKITHYFNVIDTTLEGMFKPRFKLLFTLAKFNNSEGFSDFSKYSFGQLINKFPISQRSDFMLYLKDPYFSVSTNQWRNIAAHKSYEINKNTIKVSYGQKTISTVEMEHSRFLEIATWVQSINRAIRLSEIITYLNHYGKIAKKLSGNKNKIRFESRLFRIVHNLQIVGFEFVSTSKNENTFELNLRKKLSGDLQESIIHASQCLQQLAIALFDDELSKDEFDNVVVFLVDEKNGILASASVSIMAVMQWTENKISLDEYLFKVDIKIANNEFYIKKNK